MKNKVVLEVEQVVTFQRIMNDRVRNVYVKKEIFTIWMSSVI